ncbi:hypothetical protein Nmel_005318 [Mimus melanotis]
MWLCWQRSIPVWWESRARVRCQVCCWLEHSCLCTVQVEPAGSSNRAV